MVIACKRAMMRKKLINNLSRQTVARAGLVGLGQ